MDAKKFLVITHSEDGYSHQILAREEFVKRITPDNFESTYYSGNYPLKFVTDPSLLEQAPDKETWLFVCTLDVVIPKPVQTVTRYEVP